MGRPVFSAHIILGLLHGICAETVVASFHPHLASVTIGGEVRLALQHILLLSYFEEAQANGAPDVVPFCGAFKLVEALESEGIDGIHLSENMFSEAVQIEEEGDLIWSAHQRIPLFASPDPNEFHVPACDHLLHQPMVSKPSLQCPVNKHKHFLFCRFLGTNTIIVTVQGVITNFLDRFLLLCAPHLRDIVAAHLAIWHRVNTAIRWLQMMPSGYK